MNPLSDLNQYPRLITAIARLVTDDNPVKIMLIIAELEDLGIKHGLLDADAFQSLTQLQAFLAELCLVREKLIAS